MPSAFTTLAVAQAVSLVVAEAARKPVVVQRLTGTPASFVATKLASRSSFIARAILSSASSQVIGSKRSAPGARRIGRVSRVGAWTKSLSAAPLGQSVPRLVG